MSIVRFGEIRVYGIFMPIYMGIYKPLGTKNPHYVPSLIHPTSEVVTDALVCGRYSPDRMTSRNLRRATSLSINSL